MRLGLEGWTGVFADCSRAIFDLDMRGGMPIWQRLMFRRRFETRERTSSESSVTASVMERLRYIYIVGVKQYDDMLMLVFGRGRGDGNAIKCLGVVGVKYSLGGSWVNKAPCRCSGRTSRH